MDILSRVQVLWLHTWGKDFQKKAFGVTKKDEAYFPLYQLDIGPIEVRLLRK